MQTKQNRNMNPMSKCQIRAWTRMTRIVAQPHLYNTTPILYHTPVIKKCHRVTIYFPVDRTGLVRSIPFPCFKKANTIYEVQLAVQIQKHFDHAKILLAIQFLCQNRLSSNCWNYTDCTSGGLEPFY